MISLYIRLTSALAHTPPEGKVKVEVLRGTALVPRWGKECLDFLTFERREYGGDPNTA